MLDMDDVGLEALQERAKLLGVTLFDVAREVEVVEVRNRPDELRWIVLLDSKERASEMVREVSSQCRCDEKALESVRLAHRPVEVQGVNFGPSRMEAGMVVNEKEDPERRRLSHVHWAFEDRGRHWTVSWHPNQNSVGLRGR